MSKKYPTNVEKITKFMEGGNPMRQAFVMEAIAKYATSIHNSDVETWDWADNHLVSKHLWKEMGDEAYEAFAI